MAAKAATAPRGWGTTDMTETLDQYEQDESGGADFFKFKDGDNEVRLCPPAPGEKKPFIKRAQHWRVGPADKIFNCPRAIDETAACFVCDKMKELKASDDDSDVDKGEDLYAKKQWLYRVIDPNNVKRGIQVMAIGIKAHKQIAKLMRDKEYGDITDPEDGINIVIEKSGSGKTGTDYSVRPRRNPTSVTAILEENDPPDIAELCKPATNKAMKAAWNSEVDDDDGKKPEPDKARRRTIDDDEPTPARSRRSEPEPEDPDDLPEDEPEERRPRRIDSKAHVKPEEPEEPRRGRRIATRPRDED